MNKVVALESNRSLKFHGRAQADGTGVFRSMTEGDVHRGLRSTGEAALTLRLWWEVLKELVYGVAQLLYVFVGLVRKRVSGRPAPNQTLGFRVEEINDEGARLVSVRGCSCLSKTFRSKSAPASTSAKVVIKRVYGVTVALDFDCHDRDITARGGFCLAPALRYER